MTFNEVLSQTIAMLGQHGRVSYRALKRQFDIDNDYLEDLKYEIIEVQQLAVDQDHNILVWTGGDPEGTPVPTSQPDPISAQPTTEPYQPTRAEPPTESPTSDAERRQLTVMFCDLADSARLSGQLDPEDMP